MLSSARSLSPLILVCLFFLLLDTFETTARAAEHWVDTRQSGPFICQATFPLKEYEPLLAELQELQPELVRILGVSPAPEPVYIYLFSDAQSHRRYLAGALSRTCPTGPLCS